ncbi:MAG: hypothetical protein L6W00_14075 [Lentisphaeria bacterium]|nr:MAG: hypothetical protein L6W00_14075 [Lentisphaeria bacterium]
MVREGWRNGLLSNHFVIFKPDTELLWISGFRKLLAKRLPELRLCREFSQRDVRTAADAVRAAASE